MRSSWRDSGGLIIAAGVVTLAAVATALSLLFPWFGTLEIAIGSIFATAGVISLLDSLVEWGALLGRAFRAVFQRSGSGKSDRQRRRDSHGD